MTYSDPSDLSERNSEDDRGKTANSKKSRSYRYAKKGRLNVSLWAKAHGRDGFPEDSSFALSSRVDQSNGRTTFGVDGSKRRERRNRNKLG